MKLDYLNELLVDARNVDYLNSARADTIRIKLEDVLHELDLDDSRISLIDFSIPSDGARWTDRFSNSKRYLEGIIESKIKVIELRLNKEKSSKFETEPFKSLEESRILITEYESAIQKKDGQIDSLNAQIMELKNQMLISQTELKNILVDMDKISGSVKNLIA